jgi:hypothetical protein
MKTAYPLIALLSAASVAAGPLPRFNRVDARSNDLVHAPVYARTEHLGELAPAAAPVADAAPAVDAGKAAADKMEAEHVAKAEAEAKAHQEGTKFTCCYQTRLNVYSREEGRRGAQGEARCGSESPPRR